MEPVRLGIVGCGGMGRRHLAGLVELARAGINAVDLIAVCDLNEVNARDLADEARDLLGHRPRVFANLEAMARGADGIEAATCTTESGVHHRVAADLLDLGLNVLVEKPLALTIRGCNHVIAAAERSGFLLYVAENFRKDPMNRLVRALQADGAIGKPQFIMETAVRGRDSIFITPWRHQKVTGTITLDAGVHYADMLLSFFGEAVSAFGQARLFHPTRVRRDTGGPGGFYEKWAANMPAEVNATGEDAIFGMITFANDALGIWVEHHAGHGEPFRHRMLFGSHGSLAAPDDRTGIPIRMELDDGTRVDDERILDYAPTYQLDGVTAGLFGGDRIWRYDFDFATTDRKLLAAEYGEFAACIRDGMPPEVDGRAGKRAVALVNALFESQVAGRPVTIAEIESGALAAYQREIDEHYGLAG
jgi:predicted dehydrogenase